MDLSFSGLVAASAPAAAVAALRAGDVMLGVAKVSMIVQGRRASGAAFAAAEAATWLSAAGIVFADLSAARAAGFVVGVALGTWLGMVLVQWLRMGTVTVRAFVPLYDDGPTGEEVADAVRALGHGATVFSGRGRDGTVDMVLSVVRRRDSRDVLEAVEAAYPSAFTALDSTPLHGSPGVRP